MIYKLTSSRKVIAKILSDLNIQDEQIRITDMKEWIAEALEKIGAVTQLTYKQSGVDSEPLLVINNFQAKLPEELHSIEQIAYSPNETGPWIPIRQTTGSFKLNPDVYDTQLTEVGSTEKYVYLGTVYPIQTQDQIAIQTAPTTNSNRTNFSFDPQYFLKPGYIVTNRRAGYLKLSYYHMPVDECGYPMVPDMASFFEALYWYVTMKLKYPEYLRGTLHREIYYDMQRSWNFYRNQAYAEALMPNEGMMESIKNQWLKMFPEINEEYTFYSGVGEQQKIYNTNYGRIY